MPIFDFECKTCGKREEHFVKQSEIDWQPTCSEGHKPVSMERVLSLCAKHGIDLVPEKLSGKDLKQARRKARASERLY